MRRMRKLAVVGAVLALAAGLGACSSKSNNTATNSNLSGRGPIVFASGKDTSGVYAQQFAKWNSMHPDEKVSLVELPESADQQRQQMVQNAQTKSSAYDVLYLDVVWTAEFAANGWVDPLPANQFPLSQMVQPAVKTAMYFGKLYAVPYASDGGLLYYRKDLLTAAGISSPPSTWAEMQADCQKVQATPQGKGIGCYAGQFDKYEGLTCNFTEAVNSAGGQVTNDQGKPNVDTPQAAAGLNFLVNGFKSGFIPKEAITYKEEDSRRAFQDGKLLFQRQWPYEYALANKNDGSSKVAGKFAVAPLPGMDGPGKSTLGGHNVAISAFSKHKASALDFIKWFTNEENGRQNLTVASLAPVYTSLYDDTALQQQFPYLPYLKQSILNAVGRPAIVKYNDATTAMQEDAYAALTGQMTTDQALKDLQTKLTSIIG